MPIYTYECTKCGHKFDEIKPSRVYSVPCEKCLEEARMHPDSFLTVTVGLPNGFAALREGGRDDIDKRNKTSKS